MAQPTPRLLVWLNGTIPPYPANQPSPADHVRKVLADAADPLRNSREERQEWVDLHSVAVSSGTSGDLFQVRTPLFSTYAQFKEELDLIDCLNADPRTRLDSVQVGINTGTVNTDAQAARNLLKAFVILQPFFETATLPDPEREALSREFIPVGNRDWFEQRGFHSGYQHTTAMVTVFEDSRPARRARHLAQRTPKSRDCWFFISPARPDPRDPIQIEEAVRKAYFLGSFVDSKRDATLDPSVMAMAAEFFKLVEHARGDEFKGRPAPDPTFLPLPRPMAAVTSITEGRLARSTHPAQGK
jgi:hypothetical protein